MKKKQLTTEKRLGVQLYLVLFLYTVTGRTGNFGTIHFSEVR